MTRNIPNFAGFKSIAPASPVMETNSTSSVHAIALPTEEVPATLASHAEAFIDFISNNPTTFHATAYFASRLISKGFTALSERDLWNDKLERGGKYFVERNGSSLLAFIVGEKYEAGNGAAVVASHVDVLAARLKPIPKLATKGGYVQLGVAPYAGALNSTWWDRDLGIGGRVLVKDEKSGKIASHLVKLDWPIARIPTLAPHFGTVSSGPFNKETQMVPIIGLDSTSSSPFCSASDSDPSPASTLTSPSQVFASTQPPLLFSAISRALSLSPNSTIVNWELELFDTQRASLGGISREFIFAGRIDDRLCSFSAIEGLLVPSPSPSSSSIIKVVALYDDEEIGSLLRQGAQSTLLPSVLSRIIAAFSSPTIHEAPLLAQTYANSFLVSADVTHALNPNFMDVYLTNHSPLLNTGVAIQADPNGHTTTDGVSTQVLKECANRSGQTLQVFQIRNDVRSGGTVGPMLSAKTGMRAIDAGLPQLSMHSIRATTGRDDPGLGVRLFAGFFHHYEEVDQSFR